MAVTSYRAARRNRQAALPSGREPRELGAAGTIQALAAFAGGLGTAGGYQAFVRVVLAYRVGNRPDRFEPRARKRRLDLNYTRR